MAKAGRRMRMETGEWKDEAKAKDTQWERKGGQGTMSSDRRKKMDKEGVKKEPGTDKVVEEEKINVKWTKGGQN